MKHHSCPERFFLTDHILHLSGVVLNRGGIISKGREPKESVYMDACLNKNIRAGRKAVLWRETEIG